MGLTDISSIWEQVSLPIDPTPRIQVNPLEKCGSS